MTHDSLRILVVDDDQSMAKTLTDIFRVKGHQAEMAHSGPEALEKIEGASFDCVISDIKMPGMDGVALHRAIRALQPDLPVVLMTAYSEDRVIQEGMEDGVVAILRKPLNIAALLRFFSYLRSEQSVVIVNDDADFCQTLSNVLRTRGFLATSISTPHEVLGRLEQDHDVLILDMNLDSNDGLALLRDIREKYPRKVVILIARYRQEMAASIEAALEIGAYTCLYKPLEIDELLHSLAEIRRREMGKILTQ